MIDNAIDQRLKGIAQVIRISISETSY